jgi:hypothetical protein
MFNFNDIKGMVLDGKVDIAVSDFGISEERMKEMDFLIVGRAAMGRIYIRNPEDGVHWNVYIQPLKTAAWIGIILFCVIVIVPMMVVKLGGRRHYTSESKILPLK